MFITSLSLSLSLSRLCWMDFLPAFRCEYWTAFTWSRGRCRVVHGAQGEDACSRDEGDKGSHPPGRKETPRSGWAGPCSGGREPSMSSATTSGCGGSSLHLSPLPRPLLPLDAQKVWWICDILCVFFYYYPWKDLFITFNMTCSLTGGWPSHLFAAQS